MSQFDSSESDPPDSSPISSGEIETPRGGFMARPGLKAPPRHAVVVRVGDAPLDEAIPLARSSFPPPPPSEPPPESPSEKVTLRAIPTPRSPTYVIVDPGMLPVIETPVAPGVVESVPPPSDAPVVANVVERVSSGPRSRRAARSRLTILAAAAAGLVLGIISVVTTVRVRESSVAAPAAAPPAGVALGEAVATKPARPAAVPSAAPAASLASDVSPVKPDAARAAQPSPAPRAPATKRSIF